MDSALAATWSRITTGRRNTIRLVRLRVRLSLRNSAPKYGMSPSSGTFERVVS